ncbi:hypothetical protein F5879DRAFT_983297, partial [Lentinula edodes]
QLKALENQDSIRAELGALSARVEVISDQTESNPVLTKAQKDAITAASKFAVWDPRRIDFSNDSIVNESYNDLKANKKLNGFKAHFDDEKHKMVSTIRECCRKQASYGKTTLRMNIIKFMSVGVTKATEGISRAMCPPSTKVGVKQTIRVLLLRCFAQERPDLFQTSSRISHDSTSKKPKRPRVGDNFQVNASAVSILPPQHEIGTSGSGVDENTATKNDSSNEAWAVAFEKWLSAKINGTEGNDDGWGESFSSAQWHRFIIERVTSEQQQFPQDAISLIPRLPPQPEQLSSHSAASGGRSAQTGASILTQTSTPQKTAMPCSNFGNTAEPQTLFASAPWTSSLPTGFGPQSVSQLFTPAPRNSGIGSVTGDGVMANTPSQDQASRSNPPIQDVQSRSSVPGLHHSATPAMMGSFLSNHLQRSASTVPVQRDLLPVGPTNPTSLFGMNRSHSNAALAPVIFPAANQLNSRDGLLPFKATSSASTGEDRASDTFEGFRPDSPSYIGAT